MATSVHVRSCKISYILTAFCTTSIWAVIEQKMRMRCSVYSAQYQLVTSSKKKSGKGKCSFVALGRDEATRTPDPYVPNVVRYQLRYIPIALKASAKVHQIFETRAIFSKKICWYIKKLLSLHSLNKSYTWCHSSVGRAKDWKSLCPRFDSWWYHSKCNSNFSSSPGFVLSPGFFVLRHSAVPCGRRRWLWKSGRDWAYS